MRFACWGLIPVVGLPLGLLGLIFGLLGWRQTRQQPDDPAIRHALGAVILASLEIVVNLSGLICLYLGLHELAVMR
jgi:hypothetical protein